MGDPIKVHKTKRKCEIDVQLEHQRVGIRGAFSEWIDVISGMPQGSVLEPEIKFL